MRLGKLASKLQLSRLRDYGYKILGRVKGLNQDIDQIILEKKLMIQAEENLRSSPLETTVFFFGKVKGKRLIATDILIPEEKDYKKRTFGHVHVSPRYIAKEFPKLQKQGKTLLVTMHSHPMDVLSFGDVNTHMNVARHYPHQLSGVYNQGRIFFYRFENGMKQTPLKILDLSRFDRQIKAFGQEGQLLISASTAALIGVGGGNTKIAFDLASMGIGNILLFDPDKWEEHNRNRIFIPPNCVGNFKASSVKDLIQSYYSDVEVAAYLDKVENYEPLLPEILSDVDFLVVGPDNIAARIFCNRLALKLNKPAIFLGAKIESKEGKLVTMGGSVQVVIPNVSPCFEGITSVSQLDVMRETLDVETKKKLTEKYGLGDLLEIPSAPAIASLNDVITGMALWEIVKLVTGIELNRDYQIYDALKAEIRPVEIVKNPHCPACGIRQETEFDKTKMCLSFEDSDDLLSVIKKEESGRWKKTKQKL